MRNTGKLFAAGLRQIARDGMLLVLVPAPLFAGLFFRFAIPLIDRALTERFSFSIAAWYGLADGMLICLAPMFVAIISAFLILEERDEGLGAFYQITPSAGYPYLLARIGISMGWALGVTLLVALACKLSPLSFQTVLQSAIVSSLTGIFLAMMVVSLAGNRVEGLAVSKLTGISFAGLILLWFVPAPHHYWLAFLPSFWIGKLVMEGADPLSFALGILTCLLWIALFTRRFLRRV
ncbi:MULTISPECIES: hypothetical protein [Eubacteriales]|uniref:Fluoroquinolone transport system permease protein n=1 Tax=Bittarella massiliensis (ex Durand et al. 2017) TaxID=1720313 RepID=A0AAQ1MBB7_9FIRM|nr:MULTISPECIES: hypothetical protein [Eubacteriales]ERI99070.1 hypothetical protein HMPREF0262_02218 [Clostridium sp. ATCC 29733]MZL68710.1 hypothetical protein [Bittarella massiliensis (ex Durand et al. 2017)]MZL81694.1 hypothetical protein [Bittarella massiliensis (ex Durand et al. 2017)]SHF69572.1 fluoroquinolone transport system permease protein [Bittarella massiliensis (ex Durand et al. 2017)]